MAVNQRVLFDVPAPTVALYTLTAKAVTVSIGNLLDGAPTLPRNTGAWQAVLPLTVATVISRVALFMGLKCLGGVQTGLIGLSELLVTVLSAFVLLREKLAAAQWLEAALLAGSVLQVARESRLGTLPTPRPWTPLMLGKWAAPTGAAPPTNPACAAPAFEAPDPERPAKPASTPSQLPRP